MTAYVPNHSSSDTASIVIDFLVEVGINLVSYMPLIVLTLLVTLVGGSFMAIFAPKK